MGIAGMMLISIGSTTTCFSRAIMPTSTRVGQPNAAGLPLRDRLSRGRGDLQERLRREGHQGRGRVWITGALGPAIATSTGRSAWSPAPSPPLSSSSSPTAFRTKSGEEAGAVTRFTKSARHRCTAGRRSIVARGLIRGGVSQIFPGEAVSLSSGCGIPNAVVTAEAMIWHHGYTKARRRSEGDRGRTRGLPRKGSDLVARLAYAATSVQAGGRVRARLAPRAPGVSVGPDDPR